MSSTPQHNNNYGRAHNYGRVIVWALVILIWLGLAAYPFLFHNVRGLQVAARISVFIVLAASYDLLIGYTGIVSFAHTMFFGLGAYGAAIALRLMGPGWGAVALGGSLGVLAAIVLAVLVGLLSLRVKAIFFAMVTLAVASVAVVFVSQFSQYTGGEDGITYRVMQIFSPATKLLVDDNGRVVSWFGTRLNGKLLAYFAVVLSSLGLYLLMLRIVRSPLGSVLEAVRENEIRAEAIGYRVVVYRTLIFAVSAVFAAVAGIIYALWLKYTGPDATLSFAIMIDILLMVVIGGMGTLSGAVFGALLLNLAQYYLRDIMQAGADLTAALPLIPDLLNPDRWLLWLGIFFILLVYFFPAGISGTIMKAGAK